jgi:chorismate mutase
VSPIKESSDKLADVGASAAMAELQDIRDSIDNIDASIIHMLAERFRRTQKVGVLKARHHLRPSGPAERTSKSPVSANLRLLLNLIRSLRKSFLPLSLVRSFGIMKLPGADALNTRLFTCSRPEIPWAVCADELALMKPAAWFGHVAWSHGRRKLCVPKTLSELMT